MIKKLSVPAGVLLAILLVVCSKPENSNNRILFTTILPQKDFVQHIAGERFEVYALVGSGQNPHSYTPTPDQMAKLSEASAYFKIGVEVEDGVLPKIEKSMPDLKISDLRRGIKLRDMTEEHHHDDEHHKGERPFEWAGAFNLKKGDYYLTFEKKNGEYADSSMKMIILESQKSGIDAIEDKEEKAEALFRTSEKIIKDNGTLELSLNNKLAFNVQYDKTVFILSVNEPANYVLYTEHIPFEFENKEHFFKDKNKSAVEPTAMESEGDHHHGGKDPHIWLSSPLVKQMAVTIKDVLVEIDPEGRQVYEKNLLVFHRRLDSLDAYTRTTLKQIKGTELFVFHPAFGYFTDEYGLIQKPVETGGKEPSARDLANLIEEVREHKPKVIFVQPQYAVKSAQALAKQIGCAVVPINPLPEDYFKEMREMCTRIREGLSGDE